jgi:hypothetical protein
MKQTQLNILVPVLTYSLTYVGFNLNCSSAYLSYVEDPTWSYTKWIVAGVSRVGSVPMDMADGVLFNKDHCTARRTNPVKVLGNLSSPSLVAGTNIMNLRNIHNLCSIMSVSFFGLDRIGATLSWLEASVKTLSGPYSASSLVPWVVLCSLVRNCPCRTT